MSEAADKLAASRQAILAHMARRQRRHDPHEEDAAGTDAGYAYAAGEEEDDPRDYGEGWFGHMRRAVRTWWRYHPAHMVVDLASPLMRSYAQRRPVQLLAISAAAGAALTLARPWKLISLGTLAVAVLKSSQLSSLLMAAMSAADFRQDAEPPP
ncbi:hypothetical protein LZ009_04750 [Ramlibacter sp. XY19]|uniref:hypothetical protein n=1 Tax=Ramlibacter paludis TaxID=2908000 RepID=UPI0023D9C465|nr:hypothetical protein [Ramlibacter paludis]MCG2592085.1 hypothetical protein [Ramlibacter paludis]